MPANENLNLSQMSARATRSTLDDVHFRAYAQHSPKRAAHAQHSSAAVSHALNIKICYDFFQDQTSQKKVA